jgi:D-amino-acid dehydrogenase
MRSKLHELRVEVHNSSEKITLSKVEGEIRVRIGSEVIGNTNVIVAAGVKSLNLLASVNIKVPIRFGKGYCFDFPQVRTLSNSIYFTEAKVAVTPTDSYLRFSGTMEFGGNPLKINRHRAECMLKTGMSYLAESINVTSELKSGLRPITPDGLPVLGRIENERNLYVASGHSMLGLTLSPVSGEIIADLVTTGRTKRHISAFDPQRFN